MTRRNDDPVLTRRDALKRMARLGAVLAASSVAPACVSTTPPAYTSVSHYASVAAAKPYAGAPVYSSLASSQ